MPNVTILNFGILSFLLLSWACAVFFRLRKHPDHLSLDGFGLFLGFFAFYFILRPIDYLVIGNFLEVKPLCLGSGVDVSTYLTKSLLCSALAFPCFLCAYFSNLHTAFSKAANKALQHVAYGLKRNTIVLSVSLISLIYCIALWLGSRFFINTLLLITGLSLIAVRSKKHRLIWLIVLLAIVVYGLYHYIFIHAERRDLFKLVYVLVILNIAFDSINSVSDGKISLKKAGVYFFLLLGLIYLAFLCRFYSVSHKEKNLKQILLLDRLYTSTNPHDAIVLNLDFAMVYDDYMFLLNNVPNRNNYIYGKTYSKFIFGFIPRSSWPEKPETINILYFKTFFPHQYTTGRSRAVSMIGEMYWNFSYIGVICGIWIMGIFIRILDSILYSSIKSANYVKIMFICLLFSYILDIFRGGLFTNFAQMFTSILLFPLMITLATVAVRKTASLNSKR